MPFGELKLPAQEHFSQEKVRSFQTWRGVLFQVSNVCHTVISSCEDAYS